MREMMQQRMLASISDRKTICEFLDWVEKRNGGKLSILLPSGTNQKFDANADLDEFYDISRTRLAEEDARYGKGDR